jgi:hypothetical protein
MQVGAHWRIAPYFRFATMSDEWFAVNVRCLELAKKILGVGEFEAWIRVPLSFTASGDAGAVAAKYAEQLGRGGTVFLTVCDLSADLPHDQIAAYLRTVQAFLAAGLLVVVDCASEVALLAVAIGARGAILGTRAYRTTGESARWEAEYNPKIMLRYLVPGRLDRMSFADAQRRTKRGTIATCSTHDCKALDPSAEGVDKRVHNAHTFRDGLAHAADVGPVVLARELRAQKLKRLDAWAQALEEVMELSAEA